VDYVAADKEASAKTNDLSAKAHIERHDKKPKDKRGQENHGQTSKDPKEFNGQKTDSEADQDKDNVRHNFNF